MMKDEESKEKIIIYVDGVEVLAPVECIYIPFFARDDEAQTVDEQ